MKTILITGGAGYIGSHAVFSACERGYKVILVDNLFRGYEECVNTLQDIFPDSIEFIKVDLRNYDELRDSLMNKEVDSVLHFGALCLVNESMFNPYLYFENNTYGTANLLNIIKDLKVKNFVFSSTCATYANPTNPSVNENNIQEPESPYGESKLLCEKEIKWFSNIFDINYTILRYFNVCGAQKNGVIGDSKKPSQLLMQNAVRGALGIEPFKFTYSEVDTPDGSPIRDYVNVEDLIDAHFLALERMEKENVSDIFNVGTGTGNSVKQIVDLVMKVTGKKFDVKKGEARRGEANALYADISKIKSTLGWQPTRSLEDSINSLILWYKKYPKGWSH